jgi:iron complex outermembrane receptor protein
MKFKKNPVGGLVAPQHFSMSFAVWVLSTSCVTAQAQNAPSTAPAGSNESAVMRKIKVEADAEATYVPETSSAGAKGDLPLRDIPQSVTVFNEDLIRDLSPRVLDELADYVAGVDREGAQAGPYSISFFFRGFGTAGGGSTYNGFREYGFSTPQAAINIERIEFLKGPASVLSGGNGALAGVVNIVSKQPLAERYHRIETTIGSFDHLAGSLDTTGPLNTDNSLRYRLTASIDKDGNFVESANQQSLFISPYLSWDVSEDTRLDVELLGQDIDRPGRQAYFQRHPDFFRIPVDTQLGDPDVPAGKGGDLTRRLARLDFTHRFANGWQLREAVFLHNVRNDDTSVYPGGYDPVTHLAPRFKRTIVDDYQRERTSQTELSGEATTGPLHHQWLGGIEISRQTWGYELTFTPYSPVDIFNPQYPGQILSNPPPSITPPFDGRNDTRAVYLQDLISLGAGFKVMTGLRHDELAVRTQSQGRAAVRQTDRELSPRLGLLYQPSESITWYTSWGRSFRPNSGVSATGDRFDSQQGELYEAGVKIDHLASGLALNGAVFQYTYQNVLTTDPSNPSFNIAVGEQRSRGLELEAIGRMTNDWSIVASYSYMEAEITKDNRLPVGDRRQSVPEHSASLFNRLDLNAFGLSRWSVTAGIVYAGDRESGIPNDPAGPLTAADVRLPSYTRVDAGLIYRGDWFEARLNGRNLTDEKIYDGYNSTFEPRAPRSAELSVAVEF